MADSRAIGPRADQRESSLDHPSQVEWPGPCVYIPKRAAAIMSASPPPKDATDVDAGDPTPEKSESMDRGDAEGGAGAYNDFDVKEQDRWLPIANGEPSYLSGPPLLRSPHVCPCTHISASFDAGPSIFTIPRPPSRNGLTFHCTRGAPNGTAEMGPGAHSARKASFSSGWRRKLVNRSLGARPVAPCARFHRFPEISQAAGLRFTAKSLP